MSLKKKVIEERIFETQKSDKTCRWEMRTSSKEIYDWLAHILKKLKSIKFYSDKYFFLLLKFFSVSLYYISFIHFLYVPLYS